MVYTMREIRLMLADRPLPTVAKQSGVAHIQTHLAFLKSPVFGMNPAIVKTYIYPMAQHLRDHLLMYLCLMC